MTTFVALSFRKVISGSFSTIDGKHALRIPVFGAVRIYLLLAVFINHLRIIVRLTSRMNAVLHELFSNEYILQTICQRYIR